jgi:hypothetical protein
VNWRLERARVRRESRCSRCWTSRAYNSVSLSAMPIIFWRREGKGDLGDGRVHDISKSVDLGPFHDIWLEEVVR